MTSLRHVGVLMNNDRSVRTHTSSEPQAATRQAHSIRPASCNLISLGILIAALTRPVIAQEILTDGTEAALRAIPGIGVPDGMQLRLFAAEPQLASPVAICLDERGRVFVAEEYRFNRGTEENRTRPFLLEEDLQIETLEQRLALFEKHQSQFDGGMSWFSRVSDQVRILEDRDGDGRADFSRIFAGGFNDPLDGLGAGVIALDGAVYYTCIPHLWLLQDRDGDGEAEERTALHRGYGVNCGFLGHDLHGLVWGLDGRLYFSVGDRGYNITTNDGRHLVGPRRGAVFRCEADGSGLEVVHIGLRNPQELAFDEFGNLFAADNNCDKGDLSRLVYVVEGGDSGWNMAFQTIPDPYLTGPWHAENMWQVHAAHQPAWILPPVGALGAGPSGFVYYPGTGLPPRYNGHFFMCNYTGNGGIDSFAVEPTGAAFRMVDDHTFLRSIRATDADFGYDGRMYVADFVNLDWSGKSLGGRIYSLSHETTRSTPLVEEVRLLFADGFRPLSTDRLCELLSHIDMRVRLRSQYELARRATAPVNDADVVRHLILLTESSENDPRVTRHALHALGQIARADGSTAAHDAQSALRAVMNKTPDGTAQDRLEQVLRIVGDLRDSDSINAVRRCLHHESPRVQFLALMALSRMNTTDAPNRATTVDDIAALLERNADHDAYLRHGAVMALQLHADDAAIETLSSSKSRSVRLACVLLLRHRNSERLSQFLNDTDLEIATEAARAINDLPVDDCMADLAALGSGLLRRHVADRRTGTATDSGDAGTDSSHNVPLPDALVRRIINACYRLGHEHHAQSLADIAVSPLASAAMRKEAIQCLLSWTAPGSRDRVSGNWRPVIDRPAIDITNVVQRRADVLLSGTQGELFSDVITLLARSDVAVDSEKLATWATDAGRSDGTRLAAFELLAKRDQSHAAAIQEQWLAGDRPRLRAAMRVRLTSTDTPAALAEFQRAFNNDQTTALEIQSALAALTGTDTRDADDLLQQVLTQVTQQRRKESTGKGRSDSDSRFTAVDRHAAAIELDAVRAAEQRTEQNVPALRAYRNLVESLRADDPLTAWRAALNGGDVDRGADLFRSHRQAQCIRCHKAHGSGGDAGPDLSRLTRETTREHLLESLINPDTKIARGFGIVTLITQQGRVLSGTVTSETDEVIELRASDGRLIRVARSDIEERVSAKSPMPPVGTILKLDELRDLIEFLMSLRTDSTSERL